MPVRIWKAFQPMLHEIGKLLMAPTGMNISANRKDIRNDRRLLQ
jgi:hypothetical protein